MAKLDILTLMILICGFCILIASFCMIIAVNPIHSIIFFIIIVLNQSILLLLLKTEFLALIYLIIYIGAISILFLFIVMMLKLKIIKFTNFLLKNLPWVIFIILTFFLQLIIILYNSDLNLIEPLLDLNKNIYKIDYIKLLYNKSNIELIGLILYTYNYLYVIFAGFILLVAIVGAISLTLNKLENETKKNLKLKKPEYIYKVSHIYYLK